VNSTVQGYGGFEGEPKKTTNRGSPPSTQGALASALGRGIPTIVHGRKRHFPRKLAALASLCAGLALGPTLAIATPPAAPTSGAPPQHPTTAPNTRIPPDPSPLSERGQWVFDLRWDKGDVYLLGVHRIDLAAAQTTPRAMGRFAIELFEGPTLIERARFDFPLLGAGDATDGGQGPPSFEKKLTTRIGVMFPATPKGTKLELWDRATDRRWPLPWPPVAGQVSSTDAGGAGDDGATKRDGG
jgi:hypothetical protein